VPYYTRPGESGHPAYQNSTVVPVAVVPPASSPSPIIIQPQVPLKQQQQPVQQPPVQYAAPSAPLLQNSPAAAISQPSPAAPAPITYILPLLASTTKAIFRFAINVPVYMYTIIQATILRPLRYPLSIIWFILRPLTLLLEIVYILFIRTPYSVISWFVSEAIYPLYVFFGVAALLGGVVGYTASHVPKALNHGIALIRGSKAPPALPRPESIAKKIRTQPIKKSVHRSSDRLSSFWKEEEFVQAEEEYAKQWQRTRDFS